MFATSPARVPESISSPRYLAEAAGCATTPPLGTGIPASTGNLHQAIDGLEKQLSRLNDRLGPITANFPRACGPQCDDEKCCDSPVRSDVRGTIDSAIGRIAALTAAVGDLDGRIDL